MNTVIVFRPIKTNLLDTQLLIIIIEEDLPQLKENGSVKTGNAVTILE